MAEQPIINSDEQETAIATDAVTQDGDDTQTQEPTEAEKKDAQISELTQKVAAQDEKLEAERSRNSELQDKLLDPDFLAGGAKDEPEPAPEMPATDQLEQMPRSEFVETYTSRVIEPLVDKATTAVMQQTLQLLKLVAPESDFVKAEGEMIQLSRKYPKADLPTLFQMVQATNLTKSAETTLAKATAKEAELLKNSNDRGVKAATGKPSGGSDKVEKKSAREVFDEDYERLGLNEVDARREGQE